MIWVAGFVGVSLFAIVVFGWCAVRLYRKATALHRAVGELGERGREFGDLVASLDLEGTPPSGA